jgi:hypothetical protein
MSHPARPTAVVEEVFAGPFAEDAPIYVPPVHTGDYDFDRPWEIAETMIRTGKHFCMWGPSDIGKSYLAQSVGGYSLTCHEQMQVAEIEGHVWPSGSEWKWKDGPATKAFREGKPLILNELARCNPEILDKMLGLLDTRESAILTLPTGEVLRPTKGYVAIATANNDPAETLDIALQRRLISLHITKPHPKLLERIAAGEPRLAEMVAKSYEAEQGQLSCRGALNFLDLRGTFGDDVAARLCFGNRGRDVVQMLQVPTDAAAATA